LVTRKQRVSEELARQEREDKALAKFVASTGQWQCTHPTPAPPATGLAAGASQRALHEQNSFEQSTHCRIELQHVF
jgi:hypothetical protein